MTVPQIKISVACTVFIFFTAFAVHAQQWNYEGLSDITGKFEVNFTAGANSFLGDIGGNKGEGGPFIKDFTFKTIKPLLGASISYTVKNWVALQGGINITKVTDADSLISNTGSQERWRYYRNLSFRSNIVEVYAGAIFYPTMFFESEYELRTIVPFVSVGIGVLNFNPQAKLNDAWVDLQPLSLEGQGFPEYPDRKAYALQSLYIPASFGVKYYLNNKFAVSAGFTFRKTFTDYIDDISTTYIDPDLFAAHLSADKALLATQLYARSLKPEKVRPDVAKANSKNKDSYLNFFLTIHVRLKGGDGFNSPN
ncbi:MAG TPA: hypothetical protein PLA68_03710 [Panacibacter sp.]|nr:hypothetical protein [Panacibacter sp.]